MTQVLEAPVTMKKGALFTLMKLPIYSVIQNHVACILVRRDIHLIKSRVQQFICMKKTS